MGLISDSYLELQRCLHGNPVYGTSGGRYARTVKWIAGTRDILDYGCGKRLLEGGLGFPIANYDPAVAGCEGRPEPHEFVACTDVLEHIEPEYLEAVLVDLRRVMLRAGYFVIHTGAAMKHLADGRNAHLIQEPVYWWLGRLSKYFEIDGCVLHGNGFEVFVS